MVRRFAAQLPRNSTQRSRGLPGLLQHVTASGGLVASCPLRLGTNVPRMLSVVYGGAPSVRPDVLKAWLEDASRVERVHRATVAWLRSRLSAAPRPTSRARDAPENRRVHLPAPVDPGRARCRLPVPEPADRAAGGPQRDRAGRRASERSGPASRGRARRYGAVAAARRRRRHALTGRPRRPRRDAQGGRRRVEADRLSTSSSPTSPSRATPTGSRSSTTLWPRSPGPPASTRTR